MRWHFWLGLALALLGAITLLFTLFFRQIQTSTVNLSLANGVQVRLTASITDRGWVQDANDFALKLVSQPGTGGETPLRFGARLEMDNLQVSPQGTITRSMEAGDAATFSWQVRAYTPGVTPGVLWFSQIDNSGNGSVLYAKEFNFAANNFWGLAPFWVRCLAVVLLLIGGGLMWWAKHTPGKTHKMSKKSTKATENQVS